MENMEDHVNAIDKQAILSNKEVEASAPPKMAKR